MNNLDLPVYEQIARKDFSFGCKVIGHPILLSDVLNYIWKVLQYSEGVEYPHILQARILELWDMEKPFYNDQREETKNFIRNLMTYGKGGGG